MKKIILFSSVALACGVLFGNIFNSMVIFEAAQSDIPNSIVAAREYFKTVNPGDFFKIFSPATQIFTLLSLILFWKTSKSARLFLGIALVCYISGDIFAFTYFHPRNDLMYLSEPILDTNTLKTIALEWSSTNWLRSFILFIGVIFSFLSIEKVYSAKQ